MTYCSVLFRSPSERALADQTTTPDCFGDLNLDQIVEAVIAGKEDYDLPPFFHAPLHNRDAVVFRHEVIQDLDGPRLLDDLKAFALGMKSVRDNLAQLDKRYYDRQKDWWFLDAVELYGDAVNRLTRDLSASGCRSRGLRAFGAYLTRYTSSAPFTSLIGEAKRLKTALSAIRYSIVIQGPRVEIHHDPSKPDYSAEVEATFERFQQGSVHEYSFKFGDYDEMNHVEAQILDGVAHLYQETFSALATYRAMNRDFLDTTVAAFDREIQFYITYLDHIVPLKKAGLRFCHPQVSESQKEVYDEQGFDLALAGKLIAKSAVPVCNNFCLKDPERILVVSGPNQGGKTTFARTFGQLHYLASLGCPVPGTKAQLLLFDKIHAHFEREEHTASLRGKLEDDVVRIHAILTTATPRSIIIINEIFASTALRDAIFLSKRIEAAIMELGALCVWVTFLEELSSLSEKTVSMVSTVVPGNPAERTFKIVRQRADGLAYAMSLAEKHRVTYAQIKERIRS